jgi:2',3'-cyclic-nucleotide 2'-phosphodiesterase (5'-nucleotidase family)
MVKVLVNGAELKTMLENAVSRMPFADGRFAQVSGLCFTYDIAAPVGSRVVAAVRQAADGSCAGAPVDLTAASSFVILENDFMAAGGDGYPVLSSRATTLDYLDQTVADYVARLGTISPTLQGRISCTTSGTVVCPVILP